MVRVQRAQYIPYSAASMYALVNDIEAYPSFLPWCSSVSIIDSGKDYIVAESTMTLGGFSFRFTTKNDLVAARSIVMSLVSGPFSTLSGSWRFAAAGDNACDMSFTIECEFKNRLLRRVVEPLLLKKVQSLVDIFRQRAHEIYQ